MSYFADRLTNVGLTIIEFRLLRNIMNYQAMYLCYPSQLSAPSNNSDLGLVIHDTLLLTSTYVLLSV